MDAGGEVVAGDVGAGVVQAFVVDVCGGVSAGRGLVLGGGVGEGGAERPVAANFHDGRNVQPRRG